MGLVTFTDLVVNVSGLTNNPNFVINKIAGLQANGNTDTGDGILTAQKDFPTNSANNTLPLMILMTDGVPNVPTNINVNGVNMNATNYMIYQAAQARLAGTRLITIGFGTNGNTDQFQPHPVDQYCFLCGRLLCPDQYGWFAVRLYQHRVFTLSTPTVNVPPIITQQPVNATNNAGGTAIFSVTMTNDTPPLSHQCVVQRRAC